MIHRSSLWIPSTWLKPGVILLIVVLASACAPLVPTESSVVNATIPPTQFIAAPTSTPLAISPTATEAAAIELSPEPTVEFIPTSRGPDLEATDPATVNLASGGLQLVEFFRFT